MRCVVTFRIDIHRRMIQSVRGANENVRRYCKLERVFWETFPYQPEKCGKTWMENGGEKDISLKEEIHIFSEESFCTLWRGFQTAFLLENAAIVSAP